MTDTIATLDCGHPPTETTGCGTGVAYRPDGTSLCYSCADSEIAAEVSQAQPGHKITLYVSGDGHNITTWSGGVIMTRVCSGRLHPWSRERKYISAEDANGRWWHGTGAPGMYANLKLGKS